MFSCSFFVPSSGGAAFLLLLGVWLRSQSLLLCGTAWFPPSFLGGVAVFPFPFGGVAFLLLPLVWLRSPPLVLGGAAWFPPSLALFSYPFTWCCLVSSLFGWSLLFGCAAFHPLHWVVVRFPCLLLGGATWSRPPSFLVGFAFFPTP